MPIAPPATITIRLLLFGSYAEALGSDVFELTLESPARVIDAVQHLRSLPGGDSLPPRPLCALNLLQIGPETPLTADDELAILPPLSGG